MPGSSLVLKWLIAGNSSWPVSFVMLFYVCFQTQWLWRMSLLNSHSYLQVILRVESTVSRICILFWKFYVFLFCLKVREKERENITLSSSDSLLRCFQQLGVNQALLCDICVSQNKVLVVAPYASMDGIYFPEWHVLTNTFKSVLLLWAYFITSNLCCSQSVVYYYENPW